MTEPSFRQRTRDDMLAHGLRILQTEGLAALQARRIAVE